MAKRKFKQTRIVLGESNAQSHTDFQSPRKAQTYRWVKFADIFGFRLRILSFSSAQKFLANIKIFLKSF